MVNNFLLKFIPINLIMNRSKSGGGGFFYHRFQIYIVMEKEKKNSKIFVWVIHLHGIRKYGRLLIVACRFILLEIKPFLFFQTLRKFNFLFNYSAVLLRRLKKTAFRTRDVSSGRKRNKNTNMSLTIFWSIVLRPRVILNDF